MIETNIKKLIRTIPDYPKQGIMFRDITTLLGHGEGFNGVVDALVMHHDSAAIDFVAGIEARGFILGGAVAHRLDAAFIPIRKKGKLPWDTIGQEYQLEYGTDSVEIHVDAIERGQKILIVDDLLATGGTADAAVKLVERAGAEIIGLSFVIELPDLGGRDRLESGGHDVISLCTFDGE